MTNKEKETLETMQTLTSLKYGSSVVCERKDIEILLNLIEKQQKEIEDKDKQIDKLSLIRQETKYGYENVYIMTEDRLVTIELNKFIVEIANGEFVDIRKLYDDYKDSVSKEAIRNILNHISYYLLGNLRYKDSQEQFEYLWKNLKEILGE